jgi:hypothetical protein
LARCLHRPFANDPPANHVAITTIFPTETARVVPVLDYELMSDRRSAATPDAAFVRPALEYELMADHDAGLQSDGNRWI